MAIFFITSPEARTDQIEIIEQALATKIKRYLNVGHAQWLVASGGTSRTVSDALGITGPEETADARLAPLTTIVLHVGGYFGRANPETWEWIKSNWQASDG